MLGDAIGGSDRAGWMLIKGQDALCPHTYDISILEGMNIPMRYQGHNFGVIDFDFENEKVEFQIWSAGGQKRMGLQLTKENFKK